MIEQPDKERWKDVVGYEGLYQVSNLGRVKSVDRLTTDKNGRTYTVKGKILNQSKVGDYLRVSLYTNNIARGKLPVPQRMIWDEIDAEISPMTDEQKTRMLQDEDYVDTYTKIQDMVQAEILNLVKGRIEATPEGKELLQRQLKIVKKLKGKIIQETNREMEMFRKFREFSKTHPEVTYEEFIKASM